MKDDKKIDESLLGNEKIEEAIKLLQGECTQEMLAHTLTVIRKQMRKGGRFITAVEPYISSEKINIGVVQSPDGLKWWSAFTSFDEELKGGNEVKSCIFNRYRTSFLNRHLKLVKYFRNYIKPME